MDVLQLNSFSMASTFVQFRAPFTLCVTGPSGSGKSEFVLKLLRHLPDVVDKPFESITWCFAEENAIPSEVIHSPVIETHRGVPSEEDGDAHILNRPNSLLILDDLMCEANGDKLISDLFTRGCRHRKISICILTQNLFVQSKFSRNISLSTRYFVLLKNVRDRSQFQYLARQLYPENPKSLCTALHDAWSNGPYSYLLLDLHVETCDALRFRTKIWPSDLCMIVYANEKSVADLVNRGNSDGNDGENLSQHNALFTEPSSSSRSLFNVLEGI